MYNTLGEAMLTASIFSSYRIRNRALLIAALIFAQFSLSAQPFYGASVAKRGNGNYRGSIFWINWDINNDGRPNDNIASGAVRTVTTAKGITYTMTINKINGNNNNMTSYVPGRYGYDDLKTGYNWFTENINTNGPTNTSSSDYFGYSNNHNFWTGNFSDVYDNVTDAHNSTIGISNAVFGELVEFRITVTATYNGNPINILGMIATGAESLGSTTSTNFENETFTTNGDVWQAFERVQNNFQGPYRATSFLTIADVTNGGRTVMDWNNVNDGSQVQGPGTMLWFSRGSNQVDVRLKGGGNQAVAIGFVGTDDFGDAPESYGNVSHELDVIFNGGALPTTNTTGYQLATAPLATQSAPISALGQLVDIDNNQFYSFDLLGDDLNANTNDEDALPNPYSSTVVYGANSLPLTIPVRNSNTFNMQVTAWLDINLDGMFQANERASSVTVPAGSSTPVNVNFSNLSGTFQPFKKYPLRLRMAQPNGLLADNAGTAVDESSFGHAIGGEVEDHFVKIPDTDLSGTIFLDQNRNKLFDAGEGVYPNNTDMFVYVVDASGNVVAKDTAVNGAYTLSGIPTGVDLTSLGYKVIASSQNVAVGSPLTTGAAPGTYSISGEDLSRAGSNVVVGSSNADFVVQLTGTVSGALSNVNFGVFDPALPVNFGSITARMVNGVLKVDWTTLMEENNAYFIIEASRDGKSFQEIGRVNSLAENGNSDKNIDYHFSLDRIQEMQMPIILIISMLLVGLALVKRRRIALFIVATVLIGAISCQKKDMVGGDEAGNYYIRIIQVDKDGTSTTSKAIKVINE